MLNPGDTMNFFKATATRSANKRNDSQIHINPILASSNAGYLFDTIDLD